MSLRSDFFQVNRSTQSLDP